jgi:hypothetical protein
VVVLDVVGITAFLPDAATVAAHATIVDADATATTRVVRVARRTRRRRSSRSVAASRAALIVENSCGRH